MNAPPVGHRTPDRDPGLQPERTSLAWSRTILGYVVVAAIVVKTAPHSGAVGLGIAAAYLALAAWLVVRRAPHHARSVEEIRSGRPRPPVLEVLALSLGTGALTGYWLVFAIHQV